MESVNIIKRLEHERAQLQLLLNLIDQALLLYRNENIFSFVQEGSDRKNDTLNNYLKNKLSLLQKYIAYNPLLDIQSKVVFIIKTEGRFLHVREIARIALQLDNSNLSLETYIRSVSPALSKLKKHKIGSIVDIKVANSHFNTFWGCGEWLNDESNIKPEFMYNEAELNRMKTKIAY